MLKVLETRQAFCTQPTLAVGENTQWLISMLRKIKSYSLNHNHGGKQLSSNAFESRNN